MRNPTAEIFDLCAKADHHLRATDYIDTDDFRMRLELQGCAKTFRLVAEGAYETPPMPLTEAIRIAEIYNSTDNLPRMQKYPGVQQAAWHLVCASTRFDMDDHGSTQELHYALS